MIKHKRSVLPPGIIEGPNEFDNEEYDYYNMLASPPEEAYLLKVASEDIITLNDKLNKSIRRIFAVNDQWLPHEVEEMDNFKRFAQAYNLDNPTDQFIIPETYSESDILRFLQASGFRYPKAMEFIRNNIEWRKIFFPFTLTEPIIAILKSGFLYSYGRDQRFRPILILNPKVYLNLEGKYSQSDWLHAIIYFMEYLIHHLLIPGQVETWSILTDLRGVSIFSLSADVKEFLKIMQNNYRARLKTNYLIGMGMILRGLWVIASSMLDPETNKKIKILGNKGFHEIFETINKCQVEMKFEGTSPSLLHDFFPPSSPPESEVLNPKKSVLDQLYSREDYVTLLHEGKIKTPSPFILAELENEKENETKNRHELERQAYLEELKQAKEAKEKFEQKMFEQEKLKVKEESNLLKIRKSTTQTFFNQNNLQILKEPSKQSTTELLETTSHKTELSFSFGRSPFI